MQGSDLGVGEMTALCWLHYALDEMVQTGRYLHGYDLMEGTHNMRIEVVDIVAVRIICRCCCIIACCRCIIVLITDKTRIVSFVVLCLYN